MLSISGLHKSYGKKEVLHGIDVSFTSAKVHGIIGLNGAGKTTLFQCICGLLPYTGSITWPGTHLLKNEIAYVPTEPYFFPRTTGKEYLEFMRLAKNGTPVPAGLADHFEVPLNDYIHNYSTGMKRKLAFLGALAAESSIYILDEPFNGVDIKSNLLIKKKILELKAAGKTILLSSHIISSLTELCDEVHLLSSGLIVKHYTPDHFAEIEEDMIMS